MKIIMLGAPGAGKGTQAKMIAEKYSIPHVSTGDIFRANIKNGTELGKQAKEYMDAGKLVPDELTVKILLDRVAQDDCKNGYVLDGFPRTIPQAEVLENALNELGDKIDFAVNVDVPDENIVRRMSAVLPIISSTFLPSRKASAIPAVQNLYFVMTTSPRPYRTDLRYIMSRLSLSSISIPREKFLRPLTEPRT